MVTCIAKSKRLRTYVVECFPLDLYKESHYGEFVFEFPLTHVYARLYVLASGILGPHVFV